MRLGIILAAGFDQQRLGRRIGLRGTVDGWIKIQLGR
eukprot:COSAG02_NODE_68120_length_251_cov_0.684211_1_plen_36_part_10